MHFEKFLVILTLTTGLICLIFIYSKNKKLMLYKQCKSFFPIVLIVLVFRSFLYEPFYIPSGSMKPTLLVGDFILVNKFNYGLRLPVIGTKIFNIGKPNIGDIIVFRGENNKYLIKRVIGIPGDSINYINKNLLINGKKIPTYFVKYTSDQGILTIQKKEKLQTTSHYIYIYPKFWSNYVYNNIIVPKDSYFVMGDNRDNSQDSRYFGVVHDKDILGKAFATWMSWDKGIRWLRIGQSIYEKY